MTRPFDYIAFLDLLKIAEQHHADLVFFEVQRQAAHFMREVEQLAGHNLFQAMHFGNAVAHFDYRSDFGDGHARFEVLNLRANDFVDFVCFDWFH